MKHLLIIPILLFSILCISVIAICTILTLQASSLIPSASATASLPKQCYLNGVKIDCIDLWDREPFLSKDHRNETYDPYMNKILGQEI